MGVSRVKAPAGAAAGAAGAGVCAEAAPAVSSRAATVAGISFIIGFLPE
jgi:hypothetical protein